MIQGRRSLWFGFWVGVLLIVAALSWASVTVYTLEARNAESRAINQRQEVIRLALWRMDSRLAPMIALEAARPIEDYETVIGAPGAVFDSAQALPRTDPNLYNLGFFEIDEVGQAKGTDDQVRKIAGLTQGPDLQEEAVRSELDTAPSVRSQLESSEADSGPVVTSNAMMASPADAEQGDYVARQQIANLAQLNRSMSKENPARESDPSKRVQNELGDGHSDFAYTDDGMKDGRGANALSANEFSRDTLVSSDPEPAAEELGDQEWSGSFTPAMVGAIEPRWVRDADGSLELVLIRTIERVSGSVVQGVWLDWDAMSRELIDSIAELLPTSTLEPIVDSQAGLAARGKSSAPEYRLATVPVAFIPGGAVAVDGDGWTPAMIAMLVTWVSVILAIIAVGLVLRTVLTLSSRRAHFVGAVTHELRTPLTTFRLYSQMLADGMVTDEAVRRDYLSTLKRESDRLTGIVENVLEYARISRQRLGKDKPKGEQQITVGELMARIVPPMSRLGEQAGMDLVVSDETAESAERTLTLDPHAIERIVMNLMDNACKYAGVAAEREADPDLRVHLDASVEGESLLLVVADHGPGVPGRDRRKIFGEFVRGSSSALRDRSGLGLGLALSRGLAIEMGGDLSLVRRRGHGAEFELRVPLDAE